MKKEFFQDLFSDFFQEEAVVEEKEKFITEVAEEAVIQKTIFDIAKRN